MCAGHFLCFGSRIFYLAVVVEQERFLLLKKVINFLHREQAQTNVTLGKCDCITVMHRP